MMPPVIDAFVLSYKREMNLASVIRGIKRQSCIRNIYIFHNAPSSKKIRGVVNVVSDKNFGCIARHALAAITDCDYAFFVDDDIELRVDFSKRILKAIKCEPQTMLGFMGQDINPLVRPIKDIYYHGMPCFYSSYYRYIDTIFGILHVLPRNCIYEILTFLKDNAVNELRNDDDLYFNLALQTITKKPALIIPSERKEFAFLGSPHALCARDHHLQLRSRQIHEFYQQGWRPLSRTGKYFKTNVKNSKGRIYYDLHAREIQFALKNGKTKKFIDLLSRIKIDTIPVNDLYSFASYCRDKHKIKQACRYYSAVYKKGDEKHQALACYHLACLSIKREEEKRAMSLLRQCIARMPNHKKAKQLLRELLSKEM